MEQLKGYIQNVSPTKCSKNKKNYFLFHVQTNDNSYRKAVCFDSNMHKTVKSFQDSQTAVKFKNIRRSSTADDDNYVSKRSKLENASIREVPFDYVQMTEDYNASLHFPISQLQDIQSGQVVTIKARFYKSNGPIKEVRMVDGQVRNCLENCIVIDDTGSFHLTVWGNQIETTNNGECYSITNLKVKTYLGNRNLSTSASTDFQPLDLDLPQLTEDEVADLSTNEKDVNVTRVVMAENIRTWVKCLNCRKALTELLNEDIAKCDNCDAVQRTNDCQHGCSVQIKIAVEDEDLPSSLWVVAFEDSLQIMLDKYNEDHRPAVQVTMDSADDDVYRVLLWLPEMTLRYHKETKAVREVHFRDQ